MEVDEGSDQKSNIEPNWMARLKNEFTEDEKYNLIKWLKLFHLKEIDIERKQ